MKRRSFAAIRRRLRALRAHPVTGNAAFMLGSNVSIALLQALQFLLLARALGPHEFGHVASVVAITSALLPFSGLGLGNIAVMRIARGQADARVSLGNALAVTALSGTAALGLALVAGTRILPEPGTATLLLLFGASELLMTKCIDVCAHVFFGMERHRVSVVFYNLHMLARVACAAALSLASAHPTALAWGELHLASGIVVALLALGATTRLLGSPRADWRGAASDSGHGVLFSITISARSVQTDADKSVLARLASPATAGVYTAAFRIVSLACMPVFAIVVALQARIFRRGHDDGIAGTLAALRALGVAAGTYCLLLAAAMYAGATAVPWLLGRDYQESGEVLQALCALPCLVVGQTLLTAALSGADGQHQLGMLHALAAGLSVLLNLTLVPQQGWMGSVLAAYGSQLFLVAGIAIVIAVELQRQRRGPHGAARRRASASAE